MSDIEIINKAILTISPQGIRNELLKLKDEKLSSLILLKFFTAKENNKSVQYLNKFNGFRM